MQNKAQTEILGLVVIVLILAVALMFVYFFSVRGGEKEDLIYNNQAFAQQMVSAVLQTQTTCRALDVLDVVKLCVEGNNWGVREACSLDGEELTPCDYSSKLTKNLLNQSLGLLNREYVYSILDSSANEIVKVSSVDSCAIGASAGVFPLYTRFAGEIVIKLEICEHG